MPVKNIPVYIYRGVRTHPDKSAARRGATKTALRGLSKTKDYKASLRGLATHSRQQAASSEETHKRVSERLLASTRNRNKGASAP